MEAGRQLLVLGPDGEALAEARVHCGVGSDWIDLGRSDAAGQLALPDLELDPLGLFSTPRYLSVERAGYAKTLVRETDAAVQVVHLKAGAELIGQLVRPEGSAEPFGDVRVFAWPTFERSRLGLSAADLVSRFDSDPELVEAMVEPTGAFRLTGLDPARPYAVRAIGGGWMSWESVRQRPSEGECRVQLSQVLLLCMETEGMVSVELESRFGQFSSRAFAVEALGLHADRRLVASEAAWFCREGLGHRGHKLVFGYCLDFQTSAIPLMEVHFLVRLGSYVDNLKATLAPVIEGGAVVSLRGKERGLSSVLPVDVRIQTEALGDSSARRPDGAYISFKDKAVRQGSWEFLAGGADQQRFWLPAGNYEMCYRSSSGLAMSDPIDIEVAAEMAPIVIDWMHLGAIEIEWVTASGMPEPGILEALLYAKKPDSENAWGSSYKVNLFFPEVPHAPVLMIPHVPPATYRLVLSGPREARLLTGGASDATQTDGKLAFDVEVRASEVARVQVVGH